VDPTINLDARLRPVDAAQVAGVSKQLLNWWRREGKVEPDDKGRYRLGDVLEAERLTARCKRSSRYQEHRNHQAA
jgi:predicted site-specific integrase-resolvase